MIASICIWGKYPMADGEIKAVIFFQCYEKQEFLCWKKSA
jgi:hypothetical protein